jgi:hypothetical protein
MWRGSAIAPARLSSRIQGCVLERMVFSLRRRTEWQIALVVTLLLRVFYSGIAAVSSFLLHPDPALIHSNLLTENLRPPGSLRYGWLEVWARFDTLWYLRIAQYGYDRPMSVIFYPLYPLTIKVASFGSPNIAAALVVSTVAAFFFLWGLLRLARTDLSEDAKLRTLLLVIAWPTSFILFAGYAESLTLALMVWAVILAREGRWGLATACGLLAGISRPSGVLVSIPLFVLAARSRRLASAIVLLAPVGLLGYWGWLRWTGHPSVVEAYRLQQGMTLVPPWMGLAEAIRIIATQGDALMAIKLGLVILMLVLSLRREVRIEDRVFAVAIILQMLMYTGRPLLGAARYLLAVYPAFVVLGDIAERRWSSRQFGFYLICGGVLNLAWMAAFLNWSLVL